MSRASWGLSLAVLAAASPVPAGQTADYTRTPVLMVHGWFVSDLAGVATWATMKKNLVEDGWPEEYLDTPSFKDVRGCDPEHAQEIAGWVEALIARTGADRVDILAHSEGALNTLYYLKKLCGVHRVRKVVSLAGAYHGTVVACLDPLSCGAREMCIPSTPDGWKENDVLADLLACDETPGDVLYTTVWSPWDEIIVPPEGGALAGAELIQVQTPFTEHGGILVSDESYGYVRDALLSGGANEDGPGWECLPGCEPPVADAAPEAPDVGEPAGDDLDIAGPDTLDGPKDRPDRGPAEPEVRQADPTAGPDGGTDPGSARDDHGTSGDRGRPVPSLGGCSASGRPTGSAVVWLLVFVGMLFLSLAISRRRNASRRRGMRTGRWVLVAVGVVGCGGGGGSGADERDDGVPGQETRMDSTWNDLPIEIPVDPGPRLDAGVADPPAPEDGHGPSADTAPDPAPDSRPDPGRDPAPDLPHDPGPEDPSSGAEDPAPDTPANPCPRLPAPADRPRKVVVSHPYDADGNPAGSWEVADLSQDGVLVPGGPRFEMGRAAWGEVVFTPDGAIGIAAQDDGTLGVFRVGPDAVEVVHAAFQGSFYAARVVMDSSGEVAWVLDSEWRDIGGGVYRVRIGCDGQVSDEGRIVPAKLPYALEFLPDGSGRAVLAAKDVFEVPEGHDFHLLQWGVGGPDWSGEVPSVLGSASGFPDTDAIIASMAVSPDGRFVLAGDNSLFSGTGDRVAVVEVAGEGLVARQVLAPIEDPVGIAFSPFGDAAIVVSGYGDAIFVVRHDAGDPASPFQVQGEVAYQGKKPALPGQAVLIRRGLLEGRVLVGEVSGVRQVQFAPGAVVTDLGLTSFGAGLQNMVGAVGVQP